MSEPPRVLLLTETASVTFHRLCNLMYLAPSGKFPVNHQRQEHYYTQCTPIALITAKISSIYEPNFSIRASCSSSLCTPFVARPRTMACDHSGAETNIGIARILSL